MAASVRFNGKEDKDRVPIFNKANPQGWATALNIFLMRHKRAQKALEHPRPTSLVRGREALIAKREEQIDEWDERNEVAYSYIFKATENNEAAEEITTTYHSEVLIENAKAVEDAKKKIGRKKYFHFISILFY